MCSYNNCNCVLERSYTESYADTSVPHPDDIEDVLRGSDFEDGLFSGQGYVLGNPHLVNRGDSFSVHHVPEEWMDGLFDDSRGVRGGRFS